MVLTFDIFYVCFLLGKVSLLNYYIMKKFFLRLFPRPTVYWLEGMIDNYGMVNKFQRKDVLKALKYANFSLSDLKLLETDILHSISHTKYNSTTENGTKYNKEVFNRYQSLLQFIRAYSRCKKAQKASL